jgi:hypothetical protein
MLSFVDGVFMANIHAINQRYGSISASMLSLQTIIQKDVLRC